MQHGPKKLPRAVKEARGTVQKCRDGVRPSAPAAAIAPPIERLVPPEMPMEVADVWAEYVDYVVANGSRQCDVEHFAEWCSMAAILRRCRNTKVVDQGGNESTAASPAPASYVAQFRMLGEGLGLAGPASRLMKAACGGSAPSNPFARNGRRPV